MNSKTEFNKNRIIKSGWVNPKDLTPNPIWKKNEQEEKRKKSFDKDSLCFCGSGNNHNDCCYGKTPLQILENHGYEILKDIDGNVIVGVDKSYNIYEGINEKRKEQFKSDQLYNIPMHRIKDYNSLWELTKSGWDSEGELVFPYIFIEKGKELDVYRWDNSQFLRPKCLTHNWNEDNHLKYYKSDEFKWILENQPKKSSTICFPANIVTKIGRNEKCNCGSGMKYKKCCMRK